MYGLCGCLPSLPEVLALELVSCLWLNLCMGLSGCAVAGKHRALWITWRLHSCVDKVKQQGKDSIDAFKMYILGTCMGCWQQWETIQMCACVCVCLCSHKCIKVYNVKVWSDPFKVIHCWISYSTDAEVMFFCYRKTLFTTVGKLCFWHWFHKQYPRYKTEMRKMARDTHTNEVLIMHWGPWKSR